MNQFLKNYLWPGSARQEITPKAAIMHEDENTMIIAKLTNEQLDEIIKIIKKDKGGWPQ